MSGSTTQPGWLLPACLTTWAVGYYAQLLWLGPDYALVIPQGDRPILEVIGIYGLAFLPCWAATYWASRQQDSRWLVAWIVGSSVLFRLLILPTPPFQEIDIYRYLWDGAVVTEGESPYRYPPGDVKGAIETLRADGQVTDPRLEALARAALEEPGLDEVIREIHYADLPSPYPPVSQAIFAAPALVTPSDWSGTARLKLLKVVLTAFDVATLLVVLAMLRRTGRPMGFAVAYGWCPLVMKETAGSGHLDAIAIFFATAALAVGLPAFASRTESKVWRTVFASALLLALGVGAKLYPVVLGAVFSFGLWRRRGWRPAVVWALAFVALSAALLAPMLLPLRNPPPVPIAADTDELPPAPGENVASSNDPSGRPDPTAGISAFLSRWEMNDLLFMIVVENLRPNDSLEPHKRPWFTVLPDNASTAITDAWQGVVDPGRAASTGSASFLLARFVTALIFVAIALVLAWRAAAPGADVTDALRAAFITLAWFWLLAPTQNPWYWCWAVPLLPFARLASWHALAALSLLYYTRFWLLYHCPEPGVLGTPYDGTHFFYFVIAWIEFFPWMIFLACECRFRRRTGRHAAAG